MSASERRARVSQASDRMFKQAELMKARRDKRAQELREQETDKMEQERAARE